MKLSLALKATTEIYEQRYPDAFLVLLAGSVVRGEATHHSDLDLVVVYSELAQARRESFFHNDWPVEAFIHDPKTLDYFFRIVDCPSGVPSLPDMVATGVEVTDATEKSLEIKLLAQQVLDDGPPIWNDTNIDGSRYAITNLVDDIRSPRSIHELRATLTDLYVAMANHYFRSRGAWSAKGKSIPRKLAAIDPEFSERFVVAFDLAFSAGDPKELIQLSAELLAPDGGFLFDGYSLPAPKEWRSE